MSTEHRDFWNLLIVANCYGIGQYSLAEIADDEKRAVAYTDAVWGIREHHGNATDIKWPVVECLQEE